MNHINQDYWFPSKSDINRYLNLDITACKIWISLKNISQEEVNNWDNSGSMVVSSAVIGLIINSTKEILNKHCL